ncbi:hypothetical protein HOF65_08760 [bacterium]|jgi:hypothetical protein|nr:hypothetical protein [bacterium]MBT3853964.1 hypothetical protein [bacterium]MBT5492391.1 hypothetical protein [bacterium]MBT6778472.1 hypothetical protein [bacterium]
MAYLVIGRETSFISAHIDFNSSIEFSIVSFTQASSHSQKYSFGIPIFTHFRSFVSQILGLIISFPGKEVFSIESSPFIISYKIPASFTVFVIVHGQSKLEAIGITQYLEFLP